MFMLKKLNSAPVLAIAVAALYICGFDADAQPYNLKVPTSRCQLAPKNVCFTDSTRQKNFDVGKEVTKLSDLYHFCTDIKVTRIGSPARIILALDASGSMCQEVTDCPGATNNDPTNKRVDGANAFVDSVASRCPTCEVGVIVYTGVGNDTTGRGTITQYRTPLPLNARNVTTLHTAIDRARCSGLFGGTGGMQKVEKVSKVAKRALTFTGIALDSAISMVDAGFDTLNTNGMQRHIILLTDGDWQKPTTKQILDAYTAEFPGRKYPIIHGVFISDSATHIAAGFSPFGEVTCNAIDTIPMDMSFLQTAATTTGGQYIPGSTPQTIVEKFQSLFKVIVDTTRIGLASVTFTNTSNGEQRIADFKGDSSFPGPGHYQVHVPPFDLAIGLNTFIITWVTQDTSGVRVTMMDTFTVNRQNTIGTGTTQVFTTVCGIDSVDMSITCRPPTVLMTQLDTVRAAVDPNDLSIFLPNNITVRAFTAFPDETDNRVLFLFHLDDKSLVNSVNKGQPGPGTGSPTISTGGAFQSCISAGFFNAPAVLPISGNFCFECWIKPGSTAAQTSAIASCAGFSFGLKDGYLIATIGNKTITTNHVVDKDVWQHVAVARANGSTNIYINGLPMADALNTNETVSGTFTIGNFTSGLLDEVRLSNFARIYPILGQSLIQIPTADNLTWKINDASTTNPTAVLPLEMWQGTPAGRLSFQFTDLMPGSVVINFFDTLTNPPIMWSKNGDPVLFATDGIPVVVTLLDTSHNGHLDAMDITWTDNITVKKPLASITEFIGSITITTLDGKTTPLTDVTMILDENSKTIHVILTETTGGAFETAWKEAKVILVKDFPMTTSGEPFVVTKILDGAAPIPVFACYSPSETEDTLKLTFSESVEGDSLNPNNFLRVQGDKKLSLASFLPVASSKKDNMWIIVFPYNAQKEHAIYAYDYVIQEMFTIGPMSPAVEIDFCYPVTLIDKVKVGPNPFVRPGMVNGPMITYPDGTQKQISGIKVEIRLKRPIDGPKGQEIQAWLTVFDAVGNVMLQDEPLGKEDKAILSMGWNGKNKKGMNAAGGTYLARYVVKQIVDGVTKREETGKTRIGIKTVK
jgi:hypothetical protein